MTIKVGIVGTGEFAQCLIPLFIGNPSVSEVALCDADEQSLRASSLKYGIQRLYASFDEMLVSDVEAIAILGSDKLYGAQAVRALDAGKHVYAVVPTGLSGKEIGRTAKAAEAGGRVWRIEKACLGSPAVSEGGKRNGSGVSSGSGRRMVTIATFYSVQPAEDS